MAIRRDLPSTLTKDKILQLRCGHDFFCTAYGRSSKPPGVPDPDYEAGMRQARLDWLQFGARMFDPDTGEAADKTWWAWKQFGPPKR